MINLSLEFDYYSLGDLVKIKYGKNQKKVQDDENGKYPIYGTGGLMGYSIDYLYDKPSVLIGRKGSIEKVRYIEEPFWTVDTLFYTEVNEEIVIPKFLYYVMSLIDLSRYNEGTSIPSLRTETLNRLDIPIPNLDYQKRVLTVLSNIDKKISINEEINKNLFSIGRLIFKELILNEYSNNSHSNWVLVPFNEISTVQNGFAFKSNDYCDVGCNMIRTRDITSEGFVSNEDLINLPQSFYESKKYKNYKFERLDTITVMVGASIGKMGLITDINIPSLQNQNMWRFRSKLKNISPAFVYYYVEKINKEIINMATGSARSFYRKNLFLDYECIMPSNDYLNGINPLFNSLFNKISENVAEIDKLTKKNKIRQQ